MTVKRPPESDSSPQRGKKFAATNWLNLGQMATTGTELGLTVAVLTLIGWWLDSQWNSSPWMLITGAFIGATGSMYKMWRLNKRWFAKKDESTDSTKDDSKDNHS
jgi:F0F1-type ATP synthase assembly protein I